jgi:3-hydroxyisobutyrate dehydrogenase-like beta-hydroxyacid dehydrogenase
VARQAQREDAVMAKVAVVGLGAMGSRIAERLLEAGHALVVWNRTPEKGQRLVERGASAAETPAAAASAADAVLMMVADPAALRAVTEGADGVLAGAAPGTTLIQMSTVGPADVAELASKLPQGVALLDAPVLGSISEAEEGTLEVFASGEPDVVDRWRPMISALGRVLYLGPVGAGTAAKLVANSTLLGTLGVLGEALALARALGLPDEQAFAVLAATPLSAQAERRREPFETGDYPLRFSLSLGRKDADVIAAAAVGAGLDLKVAAAVAEWFAEAEQAGRGAADYSSILGYVAARQADERS